MAETDVRAGQNADTEAGDDYTVTSGRGGSTSGASGDINIVSGNVTDATTGTGPATGDINLTPGTSSTATTGTGGKAGDVTLTGKVGGLVTGATGTGGEGSSVGMTAGIGGATTSVAGGSETGGKGGDATLIGADGGALNTASAGTGGAGGDVLITSGTGGVASGGTVGAGGNVLITAGTGATNGVIITEGQIIMRSGVALPILKEQGVPTTATTAVTLTDLQLLGGILVATPPTALNYTTRTGTQIESALTASNAISDSFDLTIINLGGTGDIITLVAGNDVSIVGSATVDDAGADINSSGTFRFRKSAANTFIAYRIA